MTNTHSTNKANYKQILLSNHSTMSYTDEGDGAETILFIHGLASYSGTWQQNTKKLSTHFRCIAIDLPGNGYSEKKEQEYSIDFYAACIYDFIHILGLKNITLCGHSMGGQIAMTLLLHNAQIAKRLVLCAPAGFEEFTGFEKTMYRTAIGLFDMFSSDENSLRTTINNSFYKNPRQADKLIEELVGIIKSYPPQLYRKMIDNCVQGMMEEPVYPFLGEITCPTLVIFGEWDALIPNKLIHPISTEQLAKNAIAKMPNAQLEMIPYTGHFVQWEAADKVNELIEHFITAY